MSVTIPQAAFPVLAQADWPGALTLDIAHFHPRSSDHRPRTRVSLLHNGELLFLRFDVDDRYVRAVATRNQDQVCRDSCVEAFLAPTPGSGYFNFEFNCGGTMLLYHVTGQINEPGGFTPVADEWLSRIDVAATQPRIVDPEITDPVSWRLSASIPLALFEHHTGQRPGNTWRGNFFKCGDQTSHPHWASWQPIGDRLRFHQPDKFGELVLGD